MNKRRWERALLVWSRVDKLKVYVRVGRVGESHVVVKGVDTRWSMLGGG